VGGGQPVGRVGVICPAAAAAVVGALLLSGCGGGSGHPAASSAGSAARGSPSAAASPAVAASPTPSPTPTRTAQPRTRPRLPLAGRVVGIDPGHNGRSFSDPAYLNRPIFNGRETEACDTTGTETDSGYPEARFTWAVSTYLDADLRRQGARVVLTRHSNSGVGPCVTTRAQIINRAHADVAIDIHGDGGPASGRGFAILEPVADGPNDRVIAASGQLGELIRSALLSQTSVPESTYDGVNGIAFRDDLAGLNLATQPKVLVECGNMRNATDAALLVSPTFQRLLARSFDTAIVAFLGRRG
jgi:N-acetylmuramoyl-L-alanine amidase